MLHNLSQAAGVIVKSNLEVIFINCPFSFEDKILLSILFIEQFQMVKSGRIQQLRAASFAIWSFPAFVVIWSWYVHINALCQQADSFREADKCSISMNLIALPLHGSQNNRRFVSGELRWMKVYLSSWKGQRPNRLGCTFCPKVHMKKPVRQYRFWPKTSL